MHARFVYTCTIYLLVFTLFVVARPPSTFDERGNIIPFGTGPGETLASLGAITPIIAFLSFYAHVVWLGAIGTYM